MNKFKTLSKAEEQDENFTKKYDNIRKSWEILALKNKITEVKSQHRTSTIKRKHQGTQRELI
jgi:hypothetical protein